VIILDTHIWIWWVQGDNNLTTDRRLAIPTHERTGLGVSAISCWEVAKLVEGKRIDFGRPVADWISTALAYPGIVLLPLSPDVAVDSSNLPGSFHKDPADQIMVATARVMKCPLMTQDKKIIAYAHVEHA
jgi:PIN domain nuclease of toxin-antitoxin system